MLLYPANNTPWEPRRLSEWIDVSWYIKTVTKKWIKTVLDWIEYRTNIEANIDLWQIKSDINRKVLLLRNLHLDDWIWFIKDEILSLLLLFQSKNEEIKDDRTYSDNENFIREVFFILAEYLKIPSDYTYEEKLITIVKIIESYNQNNRATS